MASPHARPIALVTGAASGIGRATATALAADGYCVIVCDRDAAAAAQTVADLVGCGHAAEALVLDIADVAAVKRAAAVLLVRHGLIDAVVANAGISGHGARFAEVTEADYDTMMNVHVRGHFFLLQALTPAMAAAKRGAVVIVSSIYARLGPARAPHYAAAKGALLALTKALAADMGPAGVRVNAVLPGLVRTAMTEASAAANPTLFDDRQTAVPLRRLTTPDEVAATIAWLVSSASSSLTGQAISPSAGEWMAD